ncbi:tetratricopeptide repeat protein [Dactylosporangium sp. NPDC000555]|uniref:ATP-binding protein n=1 Tax=Dactylosporangium sp. NPDC000555 TaxID=3154260 RepID=UPI003330DB52
MTAATTEEFLALLRRLRARSGLTYRAIARRAADHGDALPASTLATMLQRSTLPRRELVVALLRACDVPRERRGAWLASWERLAGDGAAGPAPVKAPHAVPFQLPPPPAVFIGRADLASRLAAAANAREHAVCVIEGPAGIGKSALALQVAHAVAARHRGGCLHADLRGASAGVGPADPAEVLARFLRALGARSAPASLEEAAAQFRTLTAAEGVLVVLDNAASAAQVRPLLAAGPGCTTLVTSRWKLPDLDATHRFPVGPLPDDAAVELLGRLCGPERLRAERAAVDAIVHRCGGLPLALRIVGARAAARPDSGLARFAERMCDEGRRLDELAIGDLSVRASLQLGYRALSGDSRLPARLFRLMAVPDWADAAAPECAALLGGTVAEAEQAVDTLVDAHLLEPAGDGRYRFHDTVRLFARERAEATEPAAERAAALDRLMGHLRAVATTAARMLYPHDDLPSVDAPEAGAAARLTGKAEALAWLDREYRNLLAVARQQLAAGLSLTEVRDLALVVYRFVESSGYIAAQEQFGRLAVAAAELLGDHAGAVSTRNVLAVALLRDGRLDEGIEILERNLIAQRERGDRAGEASCLNNLGNALRDKGDTAAALRHLRASLAIRRELGDRHKEGSVLDNLGLVYQLTGQYGLAVEHHLAGLAITRELEDRHREGFMLVNLAETLQLAGDHEAAAEQAANALILCREFNHRRGVGLAHRVLGDACAALGRATEADEHRRRALELLADTDQEAWSTVRTATRAALPSSGCRSRLPHPG